MASGCSIPAVHTTITSSIKTINYTTIHVAIDLYNSPLAHGHSYPSSGQSNTSSPIGPTTNLLSRLVQRTQSLLQSLNNHNAISSSITSLRKLRPFSNLTIHRNICEHDEDLPLDAAPSTLDPREPDDPSPYLLAIWTPGKNTRHCGHLNW
ncbi:Transcriptional activator DEMETER [Platanthera guangdongensis]|uniref:Transcriptional activator DEMETER n=1 Tax=Platanthera guangdongensis TaxID=2320717 RepID=A0ABR2MQU0_9ASPA